MKGEPHAKMLVAAAAAGPMVVLLSFVVVYVTAIPDTLAVTLNDLAVMAGILFASLAIGFVPALAIIGIGVVLMDLLASWHPAAGHPLAWTVAGGLLAGGTVLGLRGGAELVFAFGGSGAVCALLSHPLRRHEGGGYRLRP